MNQRPAPSPGGSRSNVNSPLGPLAFLALLLTLVLTGGCKVGPNFKTPEAPVASQWSTNGPAGTNRLNAADAYWWRQFNDPILDQLVETAFRNNPTLQSAGVRILQARAQLNYAIGNLFPQQQGLSSGVNYTRLNPSSLAFSPAGLSPDFLTDQMLFSASWEIDLWGKYRRTIESDRATFVGTLASYDDALVTLIADVATSYINIRTAEERLRVAQRNAETQTESQRVASARFRLGESPELDVQQASTLLSQTRSQIPRLQNTLNQARNGLAVQLGLPPDQVNALLKGPAPIPTCPDTVSVGIPRDLLRRRPDVRAAAFAAASQSALIGVARANMYPALSLSGAFGFTSNNEGNSSLSDMFLWQSRAAQAGASLVWPVFNYGRLVNQVRVQDASFQQAVLNYQNVVLTAQQEVENGLSAYTTERQALDQLTAAANAARRSANLSLVQYKAGEADYTTVLSAEQSQLSVEDSVASSQGNLALGWIALYRALGGGWELREEHDVVSEEIKAAMARRTDWGKLLEPAHHLPTQPPEEP